MSYIPKIFDRANIQNITQYLLWKESVTKVSEKSYEQRLEEHKEPAIEIIESKFPDMHENDEIIGEIHKYAEVVQDVYMEIGMQCGAFIAFQLLKNFNND